MFIIYSATQKEFIEFPVIIVIVKEKKSFTVLSIHDILRNYWGYASFRPLQEEIINSVLEGKDTLALLPTGGGKSVCFQVPALAIEGMCLVITPLIALMRDQVENLRRKGIKAAAIHSGMHSSEIDVVLNNCIYGNMKFLYLSPERIQSEAFQVNLHRMKVTLLAIDEAHCISQWGYDFRPPYLKIAVLREFFPASPVLALTATATVPVVKDIQDKLKFRTENVFQGSFERSNLVYFVFKEEDKYGRLLKITKKVRGSGIVYVRNRRKTKEISDLLNKNQVTADFYHAGLDTSVRDKKQDAWIAGKNRVIVATNAFGMGIDKPDVRFVVHMDITDSIEAYFQEAGRAGRDGKKSYAVLLFNESDLSDARHNLSLTYPLPKTIKAVYHALGNYFQLPAGSGKDQVFEFELSEFCRNYKFDAVTVYNSLKFLEKEGYILLNETLNEPSKVYIRAGREALYQYQVEHALLDNFIKTLLRSYGGLFSDFVKISESELARRSGQSKENTVHYLDEMYHAGLISYVHQTTKPQIIFTDHRLDSLHVIISDKNYNDRKKSAQRRLDAVMGYLKNISLCRSQQLIAYFGETQGRPCGSCDVCIGHHKTGVSEEDFEQVVTRIKPHLLRRFCTLEELVDASGGLKENTVLDVVRWLLDNEQVIKDPENRYMWHK
ncbi:MAG: RecQ family ATP-dependent DNA helicase [Bacteroidetes bacterium]|nr:RecQ family ATP-dependent DNA helicase [Bacteroidota bacterium]